MSSQMQQGQPRIGILYTGGTFGMVPSERGYVPSDDLPDRVERALSGELRSWLHWIEHGAGPPVNSADVSPRYWYRLAEAIRSRADAYDGFVVIHGTDTLSYTGSALSFLLAGLGHPVVVTGSSLPLVEEGSDALPNFEGALRAAASPRLTDVGLAFGDSLFRANRSSKRFGTFDNPFASPNAAPLAHLGNPLRWRNATPCPSDVLPTARWQPEIKVTLLPVFPGIEGSLLRSAAENGARGLLLECYPSGIGPGGDPDFVAAISELTAAGVTVAAIPQNQHGRVRLGQYASSSPLRDAGLISGADMTREAALTKLHYLLSTDLEPDSVARYFCSNLRGELTEQDPNAT
ncbi:MAG: asparaginase [Ectothiorhodospiraceae bacterium]|nr:asparaginase [Ectothiorhodospiraceae bacterium]